MEQIALIFGDNYIYWSAVIRVMAAAAAICAFLALYLKTGKYKKRSTAGDILDSQEAVADLTAFLEK